MNVGSGKLLHATRVLTKPVATKDGNRSGFEADLGRAGALHMT